MHKNSKVKKVSTIILSALIEIITELGLNKSPSPFFTLTDAQVSNNLKNVTVLISFIETSKANQYFNTFLSYTPEIKKKLVKKLRYKLKSIPHIEYKLDFSAEKAQKVIQLIDRLK